MGLERNAINVWALSQNKAVLLCELLIAYLFEWFFGYSLLMETMDRIKLHIKFLIYIYIYILVRVA